MFLPRYSDTLEYEGLISDLARRRCRLVGIEYDDLVQEARLEVWTKLLEGFVPTEQDLTNAMRRYIRGIRSSKGVVYEPTDISDLLSLPSGRT